MRRALTIVEMIVATALLALIMVAGAQWLSIASSGHSGRVNGLDWRNNAELTAQLIHDALIAGDRGEKDEWQNRVQANENTLTISTRAVANQPTGGPEEHIYELDEQHQQLILKTRSLGSRTANGTRILLDQVATWSCNIDDDLEVLSIAITSTSGETVQRSYQL